MKGTKKMKETTYVYDYVKETKNTFQYANALTGPYYLPKSEFPTGGAPKQITVTIKFGVAASQAA